jgi:hypothetical protein
LCPTYFHWTSSTQPPWIIDGRGRAQRCFYVGALSQRRFYARSHRDVFTCACSHRYTFTWALPYRWLHACSLTDAYLRALAGSLLCTFTKCDAHSQNVTLARTAPLETFGSEAGPRLPAGGRVWREPPRRSSGKAEEALRAPARTRRLQA